MTLVHPRWLDALTGLFPSVCTIQAPANTNVKGDIVKAPWTNVGGLVGIPCRLSPVSPGREVRTGDQSYMVTTHYVTLRGRYAGIAPHMQAVVDGVAYDIEGVTGDGSAVMTRLAVRAVT